MANWRKFQTKIAFLICSGALVLTLLLLSGIFFSQQGAAFAQAAESETVKALQPLLEQARKTGATVIVVEPKSETMTAEEKAEGAFELGKILNRAQFRFRQVLQGASQFIHNIGDALTKVSTEGSLSWILWALGVSILSLIVGRFLASRINTWARDTFAGSFAEHPRDRATKIGYLLFRAFMMALAATIASIFAAFVVWIIAYNYRETLVTGLTVVGVFFTIRISRAMMFNIIVPDIPHYRLFSLDDETASSLYRSLIGVLGLSATMLGLCLWMDALGLDNSSHKLALICTGAVVVAMLIGLAASYRKVLTQAILGQGVHGYFPFWRRALSKTWLPLLIVYMVFAYCVAVIRLLLDLPSANGLILGPLGLAVVTLAVYGIGLIIIDGYFDPRIDEDVSVESGMENIEQTTDDESAETDAAYNLGLRPIFKGLIERALAILLTLISIGVLMQLWGFDFANEANPALRFFDVIMVAFAGYLAYQAVKIWTDYQIAQEEPAPGHSEGDSGDAEMGQGQSRLATLLPLFRNFLLITILIISGMIILAEMGINIGPIFASAGVIGLAIGFGAQTLVRDIFSGAFFLMDDAFRKGEYIDIGEVKGTVEKISIRSFQLRHHNGPLNTVPFGEIRHLKNFSRDWVMMKLKLRVTYDTDVEQVRKLVKKLGQELLEHPEVGPTFLEPLKSQGVYAMEDSAMIIRVKFMTKPGDQFMARKLVYTRIHDLFEEHGIKFAHREVTVRIADEEGNHNEEERNKTATGAVRAVIDEEGKPATAPAGPG